MRDYCPTNTNTLPILPVYLRMIGLLRDESNLEFLLAIIEDMRNRNS